MPTDLAWPEKDGTQLAFLAQIDLSQLPSAAWMGEGPRKGWLAFFQLPNSDTVRVLHFGGFHPPRTDGPEGHDESSGAYWADKRPVPDCVGYLEWPLVASTSEYGPLPKLSHFERNTTDGHKAHLHERLNLADPAMQPFNENSLEDLLDLAGRALRGRIDVVDTWLATKQLREETRTALSNLQGRAKQSLVRFDTLAAELSRYVHIFERAAVSPLVEEIGGLEFGRVRYTHDDEDAFAQIDAGPAVLSDHFSITGDFWTRDYLARHYRLARHAYARNSEHLCSAQRARYETIWQEHARQFCGGMSHDANGNGQGIESPHGPGEPNEILLELTLSELIGWMFGDCASLCFVISREDLARSDFDKVRAEFPN